MSLSFLSRWFGPSTPRESLGRDQAEPTDSEEQFRLGVRFAAAQGGAQNYPQAAHWYGKAAMQNHSLAQFNLAHMYGHGTGVARDAATSLMWLTRSAHLGDAGAQYALGVQQHVACRNADVATSGEARIEALKWVRLAADQGYRGAESACEFVALGMSFAEVAEGGRRAAAFIASPATVAP